MATTLGVSVACRCTFVPQSSLIPIAALPAWARVCFPNVTHLNTLQSRVYAAAFLSGKSMLVSAPTGAGKTNVAVLSILQQVFEHRFLQIAPRGRARPRVSHRSAGRSGVDGGDEPSCVVEEPVCFELASETNRSAAAQDLHAPSLSCARGIHGLEGSNTEVASSSSASPPAPASASVCSDGRFSPPSARLFKVVYIAPMKSLVVEVVDKLAAALGKVGLVVKEMTGDVSLSPHEMQSVHVIVTVPEKWDILTRNARNSNFGADDSEAEERNLMTSVKCIIIDEIHLLDDERGPVLESIVARVLRHVEETQVHTRLIGISATLPNWCDGERKRPGGGPPRREKKKEQKDQPGEEEANGGETRERERGKETEMKGRTEEENEVRFTETKKKKKKKKKKKRKKRKGKKHAGEDEVDDWGEHPGQGRKNKRREEGE
ncbi:putative helicase [Toxoplasma gondii ARI]|uniref:Putative helicase n=1 Tax=Toxoplasma gondii ARI TaxID=1074872 RepID=A0A139YAS5_TOXGO|nr:putative helicase [Toxoplasma gondii ARI]